MKRSPHEEWAGKKTRTKRVRESEQARVDARGDAREYVMRDARAIEPRWDLDSDRALDSKDGRK